MLKDGSGSAGAGGGGGEGSGGWGNGGGGGDGSGEGGGGDGGGGDGGGGDDGCMCSMTTDQIAPVYLVIFFMIGGGQCGNFLEFIIF